MPTLGVCTDSILPAEGPLALLALIDFSLGDTQSKRSHPTDRKLSRRSHCRSDFCYRLKISPLGESTENDSSGIYVTGKDLSDVGLGFFHSEPLHFRRVRLEAADERLEAFGLGDMSLVLSIRWCRFIGPGRYESGGRIVWPKGW